MFSDYSSEFQGGFFPITIETSKQDDGNYRATFTAPSGQVVEYVDASLNEAHRRCSDLVRVGVMKNEIKLAR